MAKRMVTRTVAITTGKAVVINVNDLTSYEAPFQLVGEFKTPEHIMKELSPAETYLKVIAIKNVMKKDVRYGMTEAAFIANAQELPPLPEREKEVEAE